MNKKEYCYVICNYLNNLKGYIEDYEIRNLLWSVFGIEDIEEIYIPYADIFNLSKCVECDNQELFYVELCKIKEKIMQLKEMVK